MRPAALVLACLVGASAGCFTPPVVIAPRRVAPEEVRRALPARAVRVQLAVDGDRHLRGWYVPADEGAPLVLHLFESSGSADSPHSTRDLLARQLADLGFASLMIDYTGVGSSDGKRSARNLERDARAMWSEALRRVDGLESRVILRATSLGTLAAWSLVADGARPAGVILLVPVRPDTVTRRFAHAFYGRAVGWLAAALFADVVDLEPNEVTSSAALPWLCVQARFDQLTSPEERDEIESAVALRGGRVAQLEHDHIVATALLNELCVPELWFLTEVVPGLRERSSRAARAEAGSAQRGPAHLRASEYCFDESPALLAATSRGTRGPLEAARLRWLLARRPLRDPADVEALEAFCDLSDPAGGLPLDLLERVSRPLDLADRSGGITFEFDAPQIAAAARAGAVGLVGMQYTSWLEIGGVRAKLDINLTEVFHELLRRGLQPADARRQFARLLLKAYRIPERVRSSAEAGIRLEVRLDGAWSALDLTSPHDPTSFETDLNLRGGRDIQINIVPR